MVTTVSSLDSQFKFGRLRPCQLRANAFSDWPWVRVVVTRPAVLPAGRVANPLNPSFKRLEQVSVDLQDRTPTQCVNLQRQAVGSELA